MPAPASPVRPARTDALTIRRARPADRPALDALRARAFRVLGGRDYSAQQIEEVLTFEPVLDPHLVDDGTYFVAELGGRLVGGGGWSFRATLLPGPANETRLDPAVDAARIRAFCVDPDVARRGVGRRLLVAAERAARQAGFSRAILIATRTGEPLYARAGYAAVQPLDVPLPSGTALHCTLMTKAL